MAAAEISIATGEPGPPEADFAFYIDFKRGAGSASRVFEATQQFIKACERFDRALAASIDANIETVMVLEDIESGSLKTWLRSVLETTDDQALKDLDWKRIVGHYLVRSKYMVLKWIDRDRKPEDIVALSEDIQQLAEETGVRHLADYPQVNPASLIEAIADFDEVKDHLAEGDEAAMIVPEGEPAEFDISLQGRYSGDTATRRPGSAGAQCSIHGPRSKETGLSRLQHVGLSARKPPVVGADRGRSLAPGLSGAKNRGKAGGRASVQGADRDGLRPR